jgi:hypothetical protein
MASYDPRVFMEVLSNAVEIFDFHLEDSEFRKNPRLRKISFPLNRDDRFLVVEGALIWSDVSFNNISLVPRLQFETAVSSRFVRFAKAFEVKQSRVSVAIATNDEDFDFFPIPAGGMKPESLDRQQLYRYLPNVSLPDGFTKSNGKAVFTFVSHVSTVPTELGIVTFGATEQLEGIVKPGKIELVQGMTENERLELRRNGTVVTTAKLLRPTQVDLHPLIGR